MQKNISDVVHKRLSLYELYEASFNDVIFDYVNV